MDYNPLLEEDFLSLAGTKATLACIFLSSGAVLSSGVIHPLEPFSRLAFQLALADCSWFRHALFYRLPCEY